MCNYASKIQSFTWIFILCPSFLYSQSEQKCYAKQNFAREDIRTTASIGFFNIDNGPIINICNLKLHSL